MDKNSDRRVRPGPAGGVVVRAASRAALLVRHIGWDDYPMTSRRKSAIISRLRRTAPKPGDRDKIPDEDGPIRSLFDDVMDEATEYASRRGVTLDQVERVYEIMVADGRHLTSHRELIEESGMSYHKARQAAAVLSDTGDVHECYDDGWSLYWVRCDEFIRRKCEERRISLCRYYMMYDILHEFQNEVVGWYVRRNRRQQQPFNLRDKKEEYVHRIQKEYFPDKPVGDEWSRHIAARYLRTAQDSIVRSMNLSY